MSGVTVDLSLYLTSILVFILVISLINSFFSLGDIITESNVPYMISILSREVAGELKGLFVSEIFFILFMWTMIDRTTEYILLAPIEMVNSTDK